MMAASCHRPTRSIVNRGVTEGGVAPGVEARDWLIAWIAALARIRDAAALGSALVAGPIGFA